MDLTVLFLVAPCTPVTSQQAGRPWTVSTQDDRNNVKNLGRCRERSSLSSLDQAKDTQSLQGREGGSLRT